MYLPHSDLCFCIQGTELKSGPNQTSVFFFESRITRTKDQLIYSAEKRRTVFLIGIAQLMYLSSTSLPPPRFFFGFTLMPASSHKINTSSRCDQLKLGVISQALRASRNSEAKLNAKRVKLEKRDGRVISRQKGTDRVSVQDVGP